MRGQKLECDEAIELDVERFVNHAHAACAELFEDFVVGEGLAEHIHGTAFTPCRLA